MKLMALEFSGTAVSSYKDAAVVLAGGAIAGVATFELNKYAEKINSTTGKPNIDFLAKSPYITGLAFALLGFGLMYVKNDVVKQLGLGMLAGGAAEAVAELVNKSKSSGSSSSTSTTTEQ